MSSAELVSVPTSNVRPAIVPVSLHASVLDDPNAAIPSPLPFALFKHVLIVSSILNGIRGPPVFIFQQYPAMVLVFFTGLFTLIGKYAIERFGKLSLLIYSAGISLCALCDAVILRMFHTTYASSDDIDTRAGYWVYFTFVLLLLLADVSGIVLSLFLRFQLNTLHRSGTVISSNVCLTVNFPFVLPHGVSGCFIAECVVQISTRWRPCGARTLSHTDVNHQPTARMQVRVSRSFCGTSRLTYIVAQRSALMNLCIAPTPFKKANTTVRRRFNSVARGFGHLHDYWL
jgi:hypothetical protein